MPIFITELNLDMDFTLVEILQMQDKRIEAPTFKLAEQWCKENAPYLKVIGELEYEIDVKTGNKTNYKLKELN